VAGYSSDEYLFDLPMTPSSQEMRSPAIPGRFSGDCRRDPRRGLMPLSWVGSGKMSPRAAKRKLPWTTRSTRAITCEPKARSRTAVSIARHTRYGNLGATRRSKARPGCFKSTALYCPEIQSEALADRKTPPKGSPDESQSISPPNNTGRCVPLCRRFHRPPDWLDTAPRVPP